MARVGAVGSRLLKEGSMSPVLKGGWAEKGTRKIVFALFLLGVEKPEVPGGTLARYDVIENLAQWMNGK